MGGSCSSAIFHMIEYIINRYCSLYEKKKKHRLAEKKMHIIEPLSTKGENPYNCIYEKKKGVSLKENVFSRGGMKDSHSGHSPPIGLGPICGQLTWKPQPNPFLQKSYFYAPVLGDHVGMIRLPATHLPRFSKTYSIGFISGGYAGHSICVIPSTNRKSNPR